MFPRLCFIILFLVSSQVSYARQFNYRFNSIGIGQGLSSNQMNCIYKDKMGFMWFGTMNGLNRYDGYSCKVFHHNAADSLSITDEYIIAISPAPGEKLFVQTRNGNNFYDPRTETFTNASSWLYQRGMPTFGVLFIAEAGGDYWFAHADSGLYRVNRQGSSRKIKLHHPGKIADMRTDAGGRLVLLYDNGSIEKIDPATARITYRSTAVRDLLGGKTVALSLFNDAQDGIWVYSAGTGVTYLNPATGALRQLSKKNNILNNDLVRTISQYNDSLIWIGTDHGGINIINKKDFSSTFITHRDDDKSSLGENAVYCLYKDDVGIMWAGTFKTGISYYAESLARFRHFHRKQPGVNGPEYDDVNCFTEDKKGNLWIGTNGGGLMYYDRGENRFTSYRHQQDNDNSISTDVVVSLYLDRQDKLWIGYFYGGMDCYENGKFTHYRHNDADPHSLADNSVWEIYEDSQHNLWVGTLGGGLDRFDREKKVFYHNKVDMPNSIHSDFISALAEDRGGNLWIGTAYGIDLFDKAKGSFIHFLSSTHKLSNDNVNAMLRDSRGLMWIGTREGLCVFDEQSQTFKAFKVADGLPDNAIFSIVEDKEHCLWVCTANGLSKISVQNHQNNITVSCRNFDEADGLQGNVFNDNAGFRTASGELVFGGANGFNLFNPATIGCNNTPPAIVFTGLQVFNKAVGINQKTGKRIILKEAIATTKQIVLKYNQNDFSVDFAALSYINTGKNKYAYRLEGFNKDWLFSDATTRRATYTNLDPGTYVLHVKAANEDGVWNNEGIRLQITILPPFWKTPLAYLCYIVFAVVVLFIARRLTIRRAHARFALAQERLEAQRLHDLDLMKIKFFTNVSHEFRTPLSLILTPLEKFIKNAGSEEERAQLELIHRNGRRVLNLVNQLMDFRKMEVNELKLNPVPDDIIRFIEEVSYSFSDLAEKKNIRFSYNSISQRLYTPFDHDKIERILFNLLSNAFKFTPENGQVSVEVDASIRGAEAVLEIKVQDTGIGIPEDKLDRIFERFFQSEIPGTLVNQGSGIGLAITREFIKMHNGLIKVESEVDKGSCFTILIPFRIMEDTQSAIAPAAAERVLEKDRNIFSTAVAEDKATGTKPVILIVEDNEDFRFYLKDNLKEFFEIAEAADGKNGWQKTLAVHPDLVVSDVSMPVMDGIELCHKIKADQRTRHIPVILLTALVSEENQLKALETGATDYLVKPFNFEIMLSRIRNILTQQKALKKTFARQVDIKTHPLKIESVDDKFIHQVITVVEKNLSNADFSVEDLSREMCMSRVSVYKKLFALTGKTPGEFIRSTRLRRAAELLEKTKMTVAEVAYEVGYNNPKYFTRYFKEMFHMLPSVFAAEKRKEASL